MLTCAALQLVLGACGPRRDPTELDVELPAEVASGLELHWERVAGADAYRLRFLRMTGAPICSLTVDAVKRPGFVIRRDSLPDGLTSGRQLLVEVRALRHGVATARTGLRPLRVP
jgi:hypothetical protein